MSKKTDKIEFEPIVKFGESYIDVFSRIHFIAKLVTRHLLSTQGDFIVNDPVSFMLKLANNFLNIGNSFFEIVRKKIDANSACALFRVQADYLVTLLLIFEGKDDDETQFRYLLYLIDGLSQRIESIGEIPQYNGSISREDYDALINRMTEAKENAQNVLDFCYQEIDKHPYKALNPVLFDKILKNKQWKYKEFNDTITSFDFYKWKDLYQLIDNRTDVNSFISLCSHYVHGNINSLLSNNDNDIFDTTINFNSFLIERYMSMLKSLYGEEDINKIIRYYLLGTTIKIT